MVDRTGAARRRRRAFLLGVTAVGLLLRLVPVLATRHAVPSGDPSEYWLQAKLLVDGKGWIEPYHYLAYGRHLQTANLPPLYTLLLTPCQLVGLTSFFASRVWSCVLSVLAVPLAEKVTRDLAGGPAGAVAAVLMALYPNVWVAAPTGFSETLTPVLILLVLWAFRRVSQRPGGANLLVLGTVLGFAVLSRTDEAVIAVIVLVGLAGRSRSRRQVVRTATWALAGLTIVVGPFVAYDSARMHHPVFVSDDSGTAISQANCAKTYSGTSVAYWWFTCQLSVPPAGGDEAAVSDQSRRQGIEYARAHTRQLPLLGVERLGRTFGLFRARQQIRFDIYVEHRPRVAAWAGLFGYYLLAVLAVPGLTLLRRRGVSLLPFAAIAVDVVVSTVVTYGSTRFRTPLEPVLVILAAVTLTAGNQLSRTPPRQSPSSSR